ncbi:MAG: GntR family transcriptional regulator [Leucobacter sp.]
MNDEQNVREAARSGVPMYRHIATELWGDVQSGRLVAGEKLPNEGVLAERFGVTRLTLRQSIIELQRLGAVEIRRGVGTFVVTPPDLVEIVASVPRAMQSADAMVEALDEHSQRRSARPVRQVDEFVVSCEAASGTLGSVAAKHLGVALEELCHLETVMLYGGKGWIANSYWYRSNIGPIHTLLDTYASVVSAFTDGLNMDLRYLWRAFSAVGADFEDAERLDVPVGAALLVRDGVSASDDGTPVYYVRRRLRGDEARFVLRYDTE